MGNKAQDRDTKEIFLWIQSNNYLEVENYVKKNLLELNNTFDREGNNLLSFAVQSGYYEICELLIKNGLPINTRNKAGNTPLHYAIAYQKQRIIQLLIDSGANENIANDRNKTPWEGL
ncbi:hypothetical protein FGO68_gene2031 [Halteria grandinella]|uniref:Ankyrin repeat domain-containing protein n=1 Tax=Halteria grandinella TaxID=5974 RepID=A0A8J8NCB2_HALGN|nr:hypothetical protein FGO68_gene15425 [Halteria grandinella]TNV71853.1 hypothetical protein FGO68_gene2031 [Halteria grandinella]